MALNESTMYEDFSNREFNCTFLRENSVCVTYNCSSFINGENCTNDSVKLISYAPLIPDTGFEEFASNSRFWIQRILVPLIMIIGVIGNTVTIFIMTQRRMRSSTNWYLAALAIFDMSYLMFSFVLSLQHYPHIHEIQYYAYWKLWPYVLTITDASSNSSVWITVTFTIERYIAVCHPMKGKVLCTESRAKKMIILVLMTCFCITLPTGFEWIIVEKYNPITNSTQVIADFSELGNNHMYMSVYYWIVSVLFVFIPLLLLAVFNAFLIKSVHLSKSRRKTMTRRRETGEQSQQESKITIMLIAVVILFLVCQLPTALTLLYKAFYHVVPGSNEDLLLRGLGNIFNFLMAVNAAGNFVLYCLLSKKYRRTFVLIFCPCLKDKIPRVHSVYQNTMYSNVDESPASARKYSVRNTNLIKPVALQNQTNFIKEYPHQKQQKSPTSKQQLQQLNFSNKVAVFTDDNGSFNPEESSSRFVRSLRCPFWRRPKVSVCANQEDKTRQFIPLKSPTKDISYVETSSD